MVHRVSSFAALALCAVLASAQAIPSATGHAIPRIEGGGGIAFVDPDQNTNSITFGGTGFLDYNMTKHLGVEAWGHGSAVVANFKNNLAMNSGFGGLRYTVKFLGMQPYGRVGLGAVWLTSPSGFPHSPGMYHAYSFGGGIDIRMSRNVVWRFVDFDAQTLPTFPPHDLTPLVVSTGFAYSWGSSSSRISDFPRRERGVFRGGGTVGK